MSWPPRPSEMNDSATDVPEAAKCVYLTADWHRDAPERARMLSKRPTPRLQMQDLAHLV